MDADRGKIIYRDRARQLRDFSGLRFGNITPTDTDMHIEYHNLAHVFGEFKLGDAVLPDGQKLAVCRLCDDLRKPALFIVASHNVHDWRQDIDAATARVTWFYFNRLDGHGCTMTGAITVRAMVELFINWVDRAPNNYKVFMDGVDSAESNGMSSIEDVPMVAVPVKAQQLDFGIQHNNYAES